MPDISPKSARLLAELVRKEIHRLAFDANLYDAGLPTSIGQRNSQRRTELLIILEELNPERSEAQSKGAVEAKESP